VTKKIRKKERKKILSRMYPIKNGFGNMPVTCTTTGRVIRNNNKTKTK
jgi:hypothetical protein